VAAIIALPHIQEEEGMTCSPIVARTELARLLAGFPAVQQLDDVLQSGRLAIDERSRAIIDRGLLVIKHEYAITQEPDWAVFAIIAAASDTLIQAFQSHDGRHAVSVMEKQAIWHPPIEITRYSKELIALHETAVFYSRLYDQKPRKNVRRTALENGLFSKFYQLYEEIKGARPGIAGPLYRFTMKGAELLGIKVGMSQDTYRMRIQRVLNEQRKKIGSLGSVLEQNVGRD
jgi:hypothetical protein